MDFLFELINKAKNCFKPATKEIYLVEVIYKSGKAVMFWCDEYEIEEDHRGTTYNFSQVYPRHDVSSPQCIHLGAPDISSVWQVGTMKVKA